MTDISPEVQRFVVERIQSVAQLELAETSDRRPRAITAMIFADAFRIRRKGDWMATAVYSQAAKRSRGQGCSLP